MNRFANESKFGILGFYYFKYLYSTHISDFMVFFRRLMARVIFVSIFYSEYCFDKSVNLFSCRICISRCSVGVSCLWKTFGLFYVCNYKYVLCVPECVYTFAYMHIHPVISTPVHTYIFRVVVFSFLSELNVYENIVDSTDRYILR